MVIAILANEEQKNELLPMNVADDTEVIWADSIRALGIIEADAYVDLEFSYDHERLARLKKLLPRPVAVNCVAHSITDMPVPFIRVNAWPGFLKEPLEVAAADEGPALKLFNTLGLTINFVTDQPIFHSCRLFAIMVNEAWKLIEAGHDDKGVDAAFIRCSPMGLGLMESTETVGKEHLSSLLAEMKRTDPGLVTARTFSDDVNLTAG